MENIQIVNYNNKPIYVSNNGMIDWYLVIKSLFVNLSQEEGSLVKPLTEQDFHEYQSKFTIKGDSVQTYRTGYGLDVWMWSQMQNDFIKRS